MLTTYIVYVTLYIYIYFLSLFYFLSFQRSLGFFLTSIDFLLCGNQWEKPLLRVLLSYVI